MLATNFTTSFCTFFTNWDCRVDSSSEMSEDVEIPWAEAISAMVFPDFRSLCRVEVVSFKSDANAVIMLLC